jgi:hypothetical protein
MATESFGIWYTCGKKHHHDRLTNHGCDAYMYPRYPCVCCLLVRCSLMPAAAARSLRATAAASLLLAVACCCRKFAACCSLPARCCSLPLPAAARCYLPLLLAAAKNPPCVTSGGLVPRLWQDTRMQLFVVHTSMGV